MHYSQLFNLLRETGLSPEQSGKRLGISGMTLRRWRSKPAGESLPPRYSRAFEPVFRDMAREGLLPPQRSLTDPARSSISERIRSAASGLGFPESLSAARKHDPDELVLGLAQIGSEPKHRNTVILHRKRITAFAKIDGDWKRTITGLLGALRAKKTSHLARTVVIGALVYLLVPNDIIPDFIPTFGLLDDFAILQLALAFNLR